ncbi:MAG: diguanylate cyclase [Pirellulaceae bacterium]
MSAERANLLIVDDDPAMLRLLRKWLETDGYAVRTADDGRQAVEMIEQACPEIILTDWEMPCMDGAELCRWVRGKNLPNYVYTVFLTARRGIDDIVQGLESGADDFLPKPVDRSELLARLRVGKRMIELEHRLNYLAKCDPLTGLSTQRTLFETLDRHWHLTQRRQAPLSCVMVDIDFFKRVNDTYGHSTGDEVIRHVGRMLSEHCHTSDLISRYGGEEFCIALPDVDEVGAADWANQLRRLISDHDVEIEGRSIHITASFGVAQRLDDTQSPAELVDMADQALLVAKRAGRDRVVEFGSITESHQGEAERNPESMFGGIRAGEVMTTLVAALSQHESAGHAAEYFLRFRINSAPVVDDSGRLVGILAEKDVMSIMLWPNWWETKIRDIMKRNVVCYDENASVQLIYEFLCRVAIRGVIIVRDERPTGVISRGSVLRWFTNTMIIDAPPTAEAPDGGFFDAPQKTRENLAATANAVQREAQRLADRLNTDDRDAMPAVVGATSRMQELLNDLLAHSRYLNGPWSNGSFDHGRGQSTTDDNDTQRGLMGMLGTSDDEPDQRAAAFRQPTDGELKPPKPLLP